MEIPIFVFSVSMPSISGFCTAVSSVFSAARIRSVPVNADVAVTAQNTAASILRFISFSSLKAPGTLFPGIFILTVLLSKIHMFFSVPGILVFRTARVNSASSRTWGQKLPVPVNYLQKKNPCVILKQKEQKTSVFIMILYLQPFLFL